MTVYIEMEIEKFFSYKFFEYLKVYNIDNDYYIKSNDIYFLKDRTLYEEFYPFLKINIKNIIKMEENEKIKYTEMENFIFNYCILLAKIFNWENKILQKNNKHKRIWIPLPIKATGFIEKNIDLEANILVLKLTQKIDSNIEQLIVLVIFNYILIAIEMNNILDIKIKYKNKTHFENIESHTIFFTNIRNIEFVQINFLEKINNDLIYTFFLNEKINDFF